MKGVSNTFQNVKYNASKKVDTEKNTQSQKKFLDNVCRAGNAISTIPIDCKTYKPYQPFVPKK
jgi:hypothetical protein